MNGRTYGCRAEKWWDGTKGKPCAVCCTFKAFFVREVNEVLFRSAFTEFISLSLPFSCGSVNDKWDRTCIVAYTIHFDFRFWIVSFSELNRNFCYRSPCRQLSTFCFCSVLNLKLIELFIVGRERLQSEVSNLAWIRTEMSVNVSNDIYNL